jgi:hypothetical protein
MLSQSSVQPRMRCFATFETSAPTDDIQMVLLAQPNCVGVEIHRSDDSPANADWFDIYADENRPMAAFDSTVSALVALNSAADKGVLRDFRLLSGARISNGDTRRLRWKSCTHYRGPGRA